MKQDSIKYGLLMESHNELKQDHNELKRDHKNLQRRLERALKAKDTLAAGNLNQFQSIEAFDNQPGTIIGSFLGTKSVAMENVTLESNVNDPPRKGGVPGRRNTFWNVASDEVMILVPGSKSSRFDENGDIIGGVQANSKRLLAKAIAFCNSGLISLRDLAGNTARELGLIASEVRVKASNHRGGFRRAWNNEKPAEVLGYITPETLQKGVRALSLAIDRQVVDIMRKAGSVFMSVDSSTFGLSSLQSTHWAAFEIVTRGHDAAGNPLMEIVFRNGFLHALPVQNKGTVACTDENGDEMDAFAPEKLALALIMSGIANIL